MTTTNSGASDASGAIHWIISVRSMPKRSLECSREATNGSLEARIAPALQTKRRAIQAWRFRRGQLAIALGGPTYRVSRERLETELVPMALRAAARVSEALGHVAA